jgi:hypothetical protein
MPNLIDELREVTERIDALENRRRTIIGSIADSLRMLAGDGVLGQRVAAPRTPTSKPASPAALGGVVEPMAAGERKAQVIGFLKTIGARGATTKETAVACGVPTKTMAAIFNRGKKRKWLRQVERGRYTFVESQSPLPGLESPTEPPIGQGARMGD